MNYNYLLSKCTNCEGISCFKLPRNHIELLKNRTNIPIGSSQTPMAATCPQNTTKFQRFQISPNYLNFKSQRFQVLCKVIFKFSILDFIPNFVRFPASLFNTQNPISPRISPNPIQARFPGEKTQNFIFELKKK